MADKKVIIDFEIGGQKQASTFLESLNKNAAGFAENLKSLGSKIDAVEKLGFGKALSQGFIKTKDDIVSIAKTLELQLKDTQPGAAFEAISKNLQAAEKELDKFSKAEIKAAKEAEKAQKDAAKESARIRKEAIKEALQESGGFAKAFADGTIKSLADIEFAFNELKKTKPLDDKDFLDARAAVKVFGSVFREFGSDTEKVIQDLNTGLGSVSNQFIVFNEETKQATLNTEALQAAYNDLEPAINAVGNSVDELDLQFDNLSIEKLEASIADFSTTQIQKEIAGLEKKLAEVGEDGIGGQAFLELREKIDIAKKELDEKLKPAFADLSISEIKFELETASKKQVEKNIEDLQNKLNGLSPKSGQYQETLEQLKLVKGRLVELEVQSEVIADIDISQGYIDFATKTAEGFNNAASAVGSFAGGVAEADEVTAQFEKVLQALAVVQSIQDGFKAYSETLKGANASALTLGGGLKLLKFALAATGIGAIVLAVSVLISQFGGLKKVLGIVADAAASAGDAFGGLVDYIKNNIPLVLETLTAFGKAAGAVLVAPFKLAFDAFQSFKDVLTGDKSLSEGFKDLADSTLEPFKELADKGGKLLAGAGEALADSFNKGFDVRQQLRENERQKKLLESLNAQRAARKTALEAQLSDETLTFEQVKKITKEKNALEQAAIADSIKLNQQRIALLSQLGSNLSEEQKDELKSLKDETAQSIGDLKALQLAALQEERTALVAYQDFKLAQLQATADEEIKVKERTLAEGVELQTISAEEEIALINGVADARLSVLKQEEENIKARGKLTKDEEERLKAIVRESSDIQTEASDKVKESITRRIEETKALAQAQAALGAEDIARQQLELDGLARLEELNQRRRERDVEAARLNLNNIKNIQKAREANDKAIQDSLDAQTKELQKQADLDLQNIELQKSGLSIELQALEAKKASTTLTKEEQTQIELLNSQLQTLEKTAGNVKLNLEVDTENLNADAKKALEESGDTLKQDFEALIADPLGSKLKDALIKGFGITDKEAGLILDQTQAVQDAVLGLVDTINQVRLEAIDAELSAIEEQKTALDEELSGIQSEISETQENISELQGELATAEGSRANAILAQIEGQQKAVDNLTAAEAKNAKAKEAAEKRAIELEAEKAEKEKQAAKISLAIDTAKAFAAGAIGIANAFQAPPPFGLITGLAAIATIVGAITSTLQLAKLAKGGVIPKAADGTILQGPSHAQGGILMNVGGRAAVEAEGGEVVLTKAVSSNPTLLRKASDINVMAGGRKLAAGGFVDPQYSKYAEEGANAFPDPNAEKFAAMQKTISTLAERPAVVGVVDIAKGMDRLKVQDSSAL